MEFEEAKENIQPLAAGRNASILQAALQAAESPEELQHQRRQYEEIIATYEGDDPLEPWFEYVYWIEQSYPSGGKESGLDEVLIKCLTKFEKDQRYHQDRRMIKLYIKYIDNHEKPQECYQKLYHQGIGTMVADLYICWAYYYDLMGDFRSADQIFRKGIACQAQPLQELQEAHQHFGFTMSQRILYNDESSKEKYQSSMLEKRSALTSLKSHKKKVGSIRTGAVVKKITPGTVQVKSTPLSHNQNMIQVFRDDNDNGGQLPCSLQPADFAAGTSVVKTILDSSRNQENLKEAGPWSKAGASCFKKKKLFTSESRPDFEILEDQEDLPPIKKGPTNLKSFIYLTDFKSSNDPQEEWIVPVTTENQITPNSYPSYDKCLIYPKPNMEFSLEELGCYFWCKKRDIENKFTKKYDAYWKADIKSGVRMYPNFVKKNLPNDEDKFVSSKFDPLECFTKETMKFEIDIKLYYPSPEEELQLEEIRYQRFRTGQRKFKYDCNETIAMAEEMEETMCVPTNGLRRKSFFPNRKSIFPTSAKPSIETLEKEEEKELPSTSASTSLSKIIFKKPNPTVIESQETKKLAALPEESESFSFKCVSPPLPVPTTSGHVEQQPKMGFQIFEDEDNNYEANETCSTQAFNCFIKPHSISTPKAPGKAAKSQTMFSERQQIHLNLPDIENIPPTIDGPVASIVENTNQENCPPSGTLALSPDYNDAGLTMRGKQLSTIMETSEHATGSTGSTKLFINTPDFDLEVQQLRLPLMGNICNLETVDENKSMAELNASKKLVKSIRQHQNKELSLTTTRLETAEPVNDISRLEHREDTVPTMPVVRVFEDKTETVPKILITKSKINATNNMIDNDFPDLIKPVSSKTQNNLSFFDKPDLEQTKNIPISPSAVVLNNSIFSTSAFMKFQESPVLINPKLNNSPERVNKRVSEVKTTFDSICLPNLSTNLIENKNVTKQTANKTKDHSFLPGFTNDISHNLSSCGKIKENTKDPFLASFPSVNIGEHKNTEDSFVAFLTKNRQQNVNANNAKDISKHVNLGTEKSLLASFMVDDCSFKTKPNEKDDREKSSFMLNFSPPDLSKKSMFKIPTTINEEKNNSFLPNFDKLTTTTTTTIASKEEKSFQIYEDGNLSKKISNLKLEESEHKQKSTNYPTNPDKLRANYSSPQLLSRSLTENTKATPSRPPSNESQFKSDCFFEDNIRTEAFAVNLSMIKNSTLLPNFDLHQSHINKKSINIDDIDSTPSAASSIHHLPPSSKLASSEGIFRSSEISSSPNHHKHNDFIEIHESDEETDAFAKSIYYTKTPKTPQTARHIWSPEPHDDDEDEHLLSNNFVHHEIDLDHTQILINNFCLEKNFNPFDEKLKEAYLNQVDIIQYIENLPTCKLVKKVLPLKKDNTLEFKDKVFNVIKLIGEGTFGSVYSAKEVNSGKMYALKQERPANLWEYYICLEIESRLHTTEMLSGFMKIEYALIGNNASILFSKYARYGSLIAVCNKIKKETLKNVDEYVVMHLTNQLLLLLDHLHASNIIHGDIKADNFVLMEKLVFGRKQPTIQLIDFGNSIDMSLFPKGQTFIYTHETESFKCVEMHEKRPWTYQLDLYGLAGVIHVLLFGKYMEVQKKPTGWTHRSHVPRYLNKQLWDVIFQSLLNINDCQSMPNLQHLRAQLEEELAENDKLTCQKIIEFNRALDI